MRRALLGTDSEYGGVSGVEIVTGVGFGVGAARRPDCDEAKVVTKRTRSSANDDLFITLSQTILQL